MYYVTFTGSRIYEDWRLVFDVLEKESARHNLFIKVGDCPTGLDLFVTQWCYAMKMLEPHYSANGMVYKETAKIFTADWSVYGRAAGPKRNHEMIDWEGTDKVIAFPHVKSTGTWECSEYGWKKGIPVEFPELELENHYTDAIIRKRAEKYQQVKS